MRETTIQPPQDNIKSKCVDFIHKPLFQRVLFESTLVFYLAVTNIAIPVTQQYLYYIVGKKYSGKTDNGTIVSTSNSSAESQVQETTLLVLYLNMAELFPTALMVIVLGLYSDIRGNRRLPIWLACLGNVIYGLGYILPLYISGGDIDHPATKPLLYSATVLYGLSGNLAGFTVGISSYISDTDTVERRSLRLSLSQMYYCLSYAISNYASSHWLQNTEDYTLPLLAFIICSFLVFLMVFVLLLEPEHSDTLQLRLKTTLDGVAGIKDLFRYDTQRRKIMWCVMIAFISYCFVQQGQERTTVLFLKNEPLSWDDEKIGLFYLVMYLVAGFGVMPGGPLLEKCMGEASAIILAMMSFTAGSLILAFAKTPFLIYLCE